jgi:hypothetical protein
VLNLHGDDPCELSIHLLPVVQVPDASPSTTSAAAAAAAAAAASPEQHLSAVLLPHLPLLDSLLQDPSSICSLMCTDKELLALLKSTCEGRLALVFRARNSAHELQFAEWLGGQHSCGSTLLAGHVELQLLRKVNYDKGIWADCDRDGSDSGGTAQQRERLPEVNGGEQRCAAGQTQDEVGLSARYTPGLWLSGLAHAKASLARR